MLTFSRLGDVEYFGRIGNQFFEVASTIGIATRNNHEYCFPNWKYSIYFKNKLPVCNNTNFIPLREKSFSEYEDIQLESDKNYSISGYLQSYRYFEHCHDKILEVFDPVFNTIHSDRVAIHVRRGDYLERSGFHYNLSMEYYQEAMSYFPNSEFDVFSDDINWCQNNFDNKLCEFIPKGVDILDLFFMSTHEHQIIANSSFSWWGAYLNKNLNKKVVAPKTWWTNLKDRDLIPESWIRI